MLKTKRSYTLFIYIVGTVTILSSLFSCHEKITFSQYKAVDADGWDKTSHVVFTPSPIKSTTTYDQFVGIRINSRYPFLSLNLIVEQTISPSGKIYTDTIDCQMISENGEQLGKGNSLWVREFPLRSLSLHEGDSLSINIRHNMRRDILRGVSDIGFKMEKR